MAETLFLVCAACQTLGLVRVEEVEPAKLEAVPQVA